MTTPYSPHRRAGDLVYFSGLLGRRDGVPADGLAAQVGLILEQLDQRLADAGLSRADIVKTMVWLADVGDWAAFNDAYVPYFDGVEMPARSAVGAALLPGCLVELEAIACAPSRHP